MSSSRADWIVSPLFDVLFFANVAWLLALVPGYLAADNTPHIEFWQIFFLTTPHRWLTLLLVAADRDRRAGRTWLFVTLAVLAAVVILADRLSFGQFVCVLLVNHLWNAWHFASQHSGILRMYSRKSGGGRWWLETWPLRVFIFYAMVRPLAWLTGWTDGILPGASSHQWMLDLALLVVPAVMLALELADHPWRRPGKMIYLTSVSGLYGGVLIAAGWNLATLVISLGIASAVFHAVEYLAIVTHYARRRKEQGSAGLFQAMARNWAYVLAGFVLGMGVLSSLAQGNSRIMEIWFGMHMWASSLHFAFDGMIWKLRRPETAKVLDVQLPTAATVS